MLAKDFDGIQFLDYLGNVGQWAYFFEHSEEVISMTEEKIAGNKMLCFQCQSEIGGFIFFALALKNPRWHNLECSQKGGDSNNVSSRL